MAGPTELQAENPALAAQAAILARPITPARRMADAIRALAIDAVEAAKSGHPGMPMGMADVATALWTRFLQIRCRRPALAGPRPLRALRRPRLHAALCAALPHRPGRHDDRGHQALPPAPLARRRPSGIRRAPGDRDHHRPARPGLRHRGRHGAGRAHAGGPVRQVAGGSPHLGHRLGRRPDGGHQPRGDRPGRPSAACPS